MEEGVKVIGDGEEGGGGRGGRYSGDGAKRGRGDRECADYKLLGECQRDGCTYSHMNRERFDGFFCLVPGKSLKSATTFIVYI